MSAPTSPRSASPGAPRVRLRLALVLRRFAENQSEFELHAHTADEALQALTAAHPALERQVFDSRGRLRRVVQLVLNGQMLPLNIGSGGLAVPLREGDTIELVSSFGAA